MERSVQSATLDRAGWTAAYGAGLRSYFRRRANPADVDDLVQEVFYRLEGSHRATPIVDPQRYTFTVARNVLIRYQRDRAEFTGETLDATMAGDGADHLSPERIAIGRQEYQRAIAAILALPPRARQAFQLHRFEHLTYEAVAQRLGISHNSAKELIARALAAVTKAMTDRP